MFSSFFGTLWRRFKPETVSLTGWDEFPERHFGHLGSYRNSGSFLSSLVPPVSHRPFLMRFISNRLSFSISIVRRAQEAGNRERASRPALVCQSRTTVHRPGASTLSRGTQRTEDRRHHLQVADDSLTDLSLKLCRWASWSGTDAAVKLPVLLDSCRPLPAFASPTPSDAKRKEPAVVKGLRFMRGRQPSSVVLSREHGRSVGKMKNSLKSRAKFIQSDPRACLDHGSSVHYQSIHLEWAAGKAPDAEIGSQSARCAWGQLSRRSHSHPDVGHPPVRQQPNARSQRDNEGTGAVAGIFIGAPLSRYNPARIAANDFAVAGWRLEKAGGTVCTR